MIDVYLEGPIADVGRDMVLGCACLLSNNKITKEEQAAEIEIVGNCFE